MAQDVAMARSVRQARAQLALVSKLSSALWPRWQPLRQPALLVLPEGAGCLLVGTPVLSDGFAPLGYWTTDDAGTVYGDGTEPVVGFRAVPPPAATVFPGTLAGEYRVGLIGDRAVPIIGPLGAGDGLADLGALARELFRAQVAVKAAADMDLLAGLVDEEREDMFDARLRDLDLSDPAVRAVAFLAQSQGAYERYPEIALANNVLSNLEGHLLHGHLMGDEWGELASALVGQPAPAARARGFALVRRERLAGMRPFLVAYERRMEIYDGLPRFVEFKLYRTIADTPPLVDGGGAADVGQAGGEGGKLLAALAASWGDDARALCRQRQSHLTQLNIHGWGAARRRFRYSGMGLAALLSSVMVDWTGAVIAEKMPMDVALESAVTFDGGDGDEKLLEAARQRYEYYPRHEDERQWVRQTERRRRQLVGAVLDGPGNRIVVDVSALRDKRVWHDQETAEQIGESIIVHQRPGVFTYGDGSTFVEFRGVSLIEDRRARLLHVNIPGPRVSVFGDNDLLLETRSAEFTEGLALELGALKVRAHRGTVEHESGALLIRILA